MTSKLRATLVSILLAAQLALPPAAASAEGTAPTDTETQELVQKGLTIFEIDKEVARLNDQDAAIGEQIKQNESNIDKQKGQVDTTRKHAGKVLRAYYTGERDSIWMMLFSVRSFTDALRMFEYLQMIVRNDHHALDTYTDSVKKLTSLQDDLTKSRAKLQETKANYLTQRDRLVKLQEELDRQLAASTQAEAIASQIKSLNDDWKEKGIPVVREYLDSLSQAFRELPQFLAKDSKYMDLSNPKNLLIQMGDTDFNNYLYAKSELLKHLSFTFEEGYITAKGKKDDVDIAIEGKFNLFQQPDMNEVRFTVNKLQFNGYQLPDTTIADFSKDFQLGFIPKKFISQLDVTQVEMRKGLIVVKLKLSL
ncbi:murein hydrolase activator EnvC family protein [Paenibacillus ferrarius]|uniref:murein hydrolase activator EnvC family protein n=1 Tax=Paenibacillus ferrarius TaxID=1469647 RepID=UPI003D28F9D0